MVRQLHTEAAMDSRDCERSVDLGHGGLVRAFDAVIDWLERSSERRVLGTLEDHALKDIGISRCDAYREYTKPFWR